jgi:hypothetical protein
MKRKRHLKVDLRRAVRDEADIPRGWRADVIVYTSDKGPILAPGRHEDRIPWEDALREIEPGQFWDVYYYTRDGDQWELEDSRYVRVPCCRK